MVDHAERAGHVRVAPQMMQAMSIKRSREVSRRSTSDHDGAYSGKKAPVHKYNWETDVAARAAEPSFVYAAAHRYAKDARIVHKVFGQGIVTRVDGSKIEVLFQAGTKMLAQTPSGTEPPAAPAGSTTAAT